MAKKIKIPWDPEQEGGGSRPKFKEGDYKAKIVKVTTGRSSERDTPFIEFSFKLGEGPSKKAKGKILAERLYLTPKSLGRLRLLCKAVGIKVPKGKATQALDLDKFKGKVLGVSLEDDSYDNNSGKTIEYSTVAYEGFISQEDLESGGVEEDEDEDTDDDDDDDDDEDEDEEDDDGDDDDIELDDDDL